MNHRYGSVVCFVLFAALFAPPETLPASGEFHVSPQGNNANSGSATAPFSTLERAQAAARQAGGAAVVLRAGTYYLPATLIFTHEDEDVEFRAAPGEKVVVSGGMKLALKWTPFREGILQAKTPSGTTLDQLFVNGRRQTLARYPDFDPAVRPYGGFAADAISRERATRWTDPTGGFVHALHGAAWGGVHYRITGKAENGDLKIEGGWQNNRGSGMHPSHRYVENIFEELDAPGEWFHDPKSGTLYFWPPEGLDLATATVESAQLRHLVEFRGTQQRPVRRVVLRGLTFCHAARTFMEVKEPLLRSDWTIYRGGAVVFAGAEDCGVVDCEFDQLGGNAVFVNNYNRRVRIAGCDIRETAASAVALVGDPAAVRNPLFEYGQRQNAASIDKEPGPKSDNYPADCTIEDCLIRGIGLIEKQAAGVQIAMASGIRVRHCSIYDASRAGINIGDGCWGGHVIEHCDVFDTVQETGDHGSFNAWGRDRYWGLNGATPESLPELALLDAVKPTILRNNRWRCDHGWDVDLDDGASNYEIANNLFLRGGLKLREGFQRRVTNNIGVWCSFHPHVWYHAQGQGISGDVVTRNIWSGPYAPAIMPSGKWGREVDFNLFTTSDADRRKFAANGCDAHSLTGDPLFLAPERGDFRVNDGSPALKLGFENFPMDQFGVLKPELRKLARTPRRPDDKGREQPAATTPKLIEHVWHGARVRDLEGDEFSAFGVAKEAGGVQLQSVPADSPAARDGFRTNDLIQSLNRQPVRNVADLLRVQNEAANRSTAVKAAVGEPLTIGIVRGQQPQSIPLRDYVYFLTETAAADGFQRIALAPADDVQPIRAVFTRPATHNDQPTTLFDGKLTRSYGPVMGNGVASGVYKVDLGKQRRVVAINTWSHNQNGNRGPQRFVLFGSKSENDPGWNTNDARVFRPLAEIDTTGLAAAEFQVTSLRASNNQPLGQYRWLLWRVTPVTSVQENTAFQEFQVLD